MKKQNLIYATLFSFTLLPMATSCSEEDTQDLFPEEYSEILYIKESGEQNVTLYDAGVDVNYSFMVCKGGSDPSQEADVSIQVMSQGEVDAVYTANEGVPYRIVPAESYSLDATELAFTSSDEYKQVNITLNPGTIKNAMEAAETETRWLLPLKAVSENDSVNANKNSYILLIEDVVTPPVGFSISGVKEYEHSASDGAFTVTNTFALLTETIANEWDITADITIDKEYLAAYNEANGTSYELPKAYTVPESVTLNPGDQEVSLDFTISDFGSSIGSFMLPIRLSNPSRFEIPEESSIFVIAISFGFDGGEIDRSGWKLTACSEQSGYAVSNLKDGKISTPWLTNWNNRCGFPHWVKIDMQRAYTVSQISLIPWTNWGNRDLRHVKVYYSETDIDAKNEEGWTLAREIKEDEWPTHGSLEEYTGWQANLANDRTDVTFNMTTPFTARYVKVEFLDNWRNNSSDYGIVELYLYGAD